MNMLTLKYLVTVAETGSYTRAAEKLFVSQPALSQSIHRLENELQVRLFQKSQGRLVPTEAGEIVLEKALRIMEVYNELVKSVSDLNELKTGSLSIGVSPFYHKTYLGRVLAAFQASYPSVEVTIQESYSYNTVKSVANGELDLGLVVAGALSDTVSICRKAFDEEALLAVPPDMPINARYGVSEKGKYAEVDLIELKDMNFISYRSGRNMTQLLYDKCTEAGFTPKIVITCSSADSVNAMISSGMGVGFVPGVIPDICPPDQKAVYYRLRDQVLIRTFYIISKKNRKLSLAQKCFLEIVDKFA